MDREQTLSPPRSGFVRAFIGVLLFAALAAGSTGCSDEKSSSKQTTAEFPTTSLPARRLADLASRAEQIVQEIRNVLPSSSSSSADIVVARQPLRRALDEINGILADLRAPGPTSPATAELAGALDDIQRTLTVYLGGSSTDDPLVQVNRDLADAETRFATALRTVDQETATSER